MSTPAMTSGIALTGLIAVSCKTMSFERLLTTVAATAAGESSRNRQEDRQLPLHLAFGSELENEEFRGVARISFQNDQVNRT
jgi:hypothetical protein